MKKRIGLTLFCLVWFGYNSISFAAKIFIPMDSDGQHNHLKAYGIAYAALKMGLTADWLLNYQGGSFAMNQDESIERMCKLRGVDYQILSDAQYAHVISEIANPDFNGDVIKLEKPPKICVYTPNNKLPWDDAVTLVLTYAEIPYDKVYDDEVLDGKLAEYDWLHLHHEDFTGQYSKFLMYRNTAWYQEDVRVQEAMAAKHGFKKVSQLKLAVAKKIREFVAGGGFMFAMCSATDTYDIALDAQNTDICDVPYDGDPMDKDAQQKLDFTQGFAFKDFTISQNAYDGEFSNIDNTMFRNGRVPMESDYFSLFTFSAKFDPVPTMLCQNHTTTIKGFMGLTTAFRKEVLKTNVLVMGDYKPMNEARYIHGEYGKGTWSFYGGHDPEDYQHLIGDPPTDLSLHPTSPGYRLILNNVLFPAAKKKPRKT
ncbi:MAG: asparagine synthetase B [Bacteroidetes bacterium]|nr:asparagine synthetase B [Bacteroidota bacterium]MBS1740775.1 asparagine synthetase B [Bacteroidota bacterium]